jgi:glutamate 5-kinase
MTSTETSTETSTGATDTTGTTDTAAPAGPLAPSPRAALGAARRVVVKVGSSSLTSLAGGLDPARLDAIVDALAARRAAGTQVVLVSSGAIAAGLAPLGLARRPRDLATQQAAAAVGQLALAQAYGASFGRHGQLIGQVLLTADDMIRRAHYRNAQRTLERLLGLDVLPVVNENDTVATDEIRVGDNDRLAALVAHLVGADGLVLLSDVDGLYDGDPRLPGSRLLPDVEAPTDLAAVSIAAPGAGSLGTGGMATKITAAAMASAAGIPVLLTAAERIGAALAVGPDGPAVGTAFRPSGRRMSARRFWLRHAADVRGRLQLDDGAVAAVVGRRRSLLAAGISAISGDFDAGDVVDLVAPDGTVVARGVAGFDAAELPALIGRRTRDLAPEQRREVVHADDLVPF